VEFLKEILRLTTNESLSLSKKKGGDNKWLKDFL
jgi:hypothetical protein